MFLDLLEVLGVKKYVGIIFYSLERALGQWGLDFENCVVCGFDSCSTKVEHGIGVANKLKKKISFQSLSLLHCL